MWYTNTIDGYWFEAKVYDTRSQYGIYEGRISKLCICKGTKFGSTKMVYNYDRGLDFDECVPRILAKILSHCESLPVSISP